MANYVYENPRGGEVIENLINLRKTANSAGGLPPWNEKSRGGNHRNLIKPVENGRKLPFLGLPRTPNPISRGGAPEA